VTGTITLLHSIAEVFKWCGAEKPLALGKNDIEMKEKNR
jgi:hypothetical protein